ncbi:MAG: hypothetical protein IJF50_00605 [Peptococcaceae bacterium]|nr:hypothetical protein [Peptococcaceae bacterium]
MEKHKKKIIIGLVVLLAVWCGVNYYFHHLQIAFPVKTDEVAHIYIYPEHEDHYRSLTRAEIDGEDLTALITALNRLDVKADNELQEKVAQEEKAWRFGEHLYHLDLVYNRSFTQRQVAVDMYFYDDQHIMLWFVEPAPPSFIPVFYDYDPTYSWLRYHIDTSENYDELLVLLEDLQSKGYANGVNGELKEEYQ